MCPTVLKYYRGLGHILRNYVTRDNGARAYYQEPAHPSKLLIRIY